MKLISNANKFYKMWSVQLITLLFFLEVLSRNWEQYDAYIPEPWNTYIKGTLMIASVIARIIRQGNLHHDTK